MAEYGWKPVAIYYSFVSTMNWQVYRPLELVQEHITEFCDLENLYSDVIIDLDT